MKRFLLAVVLAGLTVFAVGLGTARSAWAQTAPIGSAYNLRVYNVTSSTASFQWQPTGLGVQQQWVDISHWNGFYWQWENGGPLAPYASTYQWNGLLQNTTYYVRINTGYWYGAWIGSDWVEFRTQGINCYSTYPQYGMYQQPGVYQQPGAYLYPGSPIAPCDNQPAVRIWTDRGEGSTYYMGQAIRVCYSVSMPMYIQIINVLANGVQQTFLQGYDDGRGDCLPATVTPPQGLERLHIYGNGASASTYFYVR